MAEFSYQEVMDRRHCDFFNFRLQNLNSLCQSEFREPDLNLEELSLTMQVVKTPGFLELECSWGSDYDSFAEMVYILELEGNDL